MVAGILLFVVLVDCVLSAYLLARVRGYRAEVEIMIDNNKAMSEALLAAAAALDGTNASSVIPTPSSTAAVADSELVSDAKNVLASATPEELAQARAVLESLGL